jgi:sugar-specific transcriptional regulator TrmB
MTHNQTIYALTILGLSRTDAEIYLSLSIKGRQKAKEIALGLDLPKWKVYRSLKRLRDKRIIDTSQDHALIFFACPFEGILKAQSRLKLENAKKLMKKRKKIIAAWTKLLIDG